MSYGSQVMQKVIGGLFLLALVVSLGFGYFHVKNMGSMDMPMPGCPFTTGFSVVCSMNPIEHIEAWQHMFTAIPGTLAFVLLLSALLVLVSKILDTFFRLPCLSTLSQIQPRQTQYFFIRNYLQEFFSRGILHPKLF